MSEKSLDFGGNSLDKGSFDKGSLYLGEGDGKNRNVVGRLVDTLRDSKLRRQREKRKKEMKKEMEYEEKYYGEDVKNKKKELIEKIILAGEKIPVNIRKVDGNTIFEINLGGKKYSIMEVNLNRHAGWWQERENGSLSKRHGEIGDRELYDTRISNNEFKEYVKSKEEDGFFMPTEDKMRDVLGNLGREANLEQEADQVVMLMYLIGIEGDYWLKTNSNERSQLMCHFMALRAAGCGYGWGHSGKVILISEQ